MVHMIYMLQLDKLHDYKS